MTEPVWVEKEALLLLHTKGLARFGGIEGIRDEGLLDSALARPRNAFHYDRLNDIAGLSASYAFGLAKNHPFADGNKRAGLHIAFAFARVNGLAIVAPEDAVVELGYAVAQGRWDEEAVDAWLRRYSEPVIEEVA